MYKLYYKNVMNSSHDQALLAEAIMTDKDAPPMNTRLMLFRKYAPSHDYSLMSGQASPLVATLRVVSSLKESDYEASFDNKEGFLAADGETGLMATDIYSPSMDQTRMFIRLEDAEYLGIPTVNPLMEQIQRYVTSTETYVNPARVYDGLDTLNANSKMASITVDVKPDIESNGNHLKLVPDFIGISGIQSNVHHRGIEYHVPSNLFILEFMKQSTGLWIFLGKDSTGLPAIYTLNLEKLKKRGIWLAPWTKLMVGTVDQLFQFDDGDVIVLTFNGDKWSADQRLRISVLAGNDTSEITPRYYSRDVNLSDQDVETALKQEQQG